MWRIQVLLVTKIQDGPSDLCQIVTNECQSGHFAGEITEVNKLDDGVNTEDKSWVGVFF